MADYTQLDEETLKDIAQYVYDKYDEFKGSSKRSDVLDRMEESRSSYYQEADVVNFPWKDASNIVLPFTTVTVDQLEPRFAASIIGHDQIVVVDDFGKLDPADAKTVEKLDNAVLDNDVKIREKVKPWIHDMLLDGHKYVQIYWSYKEEKKREYVIQEANVTIPEDAVQDSGIDTTMFQGYPTREVITATHDGVKLSFVDLSDLYFPDIVEEWEDVPVIRKYFLPWGDYKRRATRGEKGWLRKTEDQLREMEGKLYSKRPTDEDRDASLQPEEKGDNKTRAKKLKQELFCLEGHILYDVDGDGIEEKLIVAIEKNTKEVLYIRNNNELDPGNRKQIQPTWIWRDGETAYGMPVYCKLKAIQEGGSNLFNTLVNSATIAMCPVFFYETGAGLPTQEVEWYPGSGIPVGDTSKIMFPTVSVNSAAFKDFMTFFIGLWERLVSISDYNIGRESEVTERTTATGTLAILQEAAILHEYLGATLHDQFTKILEIIHDLYYLNLPVESEVAIMGQPIPKRILSRNYKLKLSSSTKAANRHVDRMELQEALAAAERGVQAGLVVPDLPLRDYLATFKNINVDQWMNGPLSQIYQRIRTAMEMQEKGKGMDPFPQAVASLMQMPPEMIGQLMQMVGQMGGVQPPPDPETQKVELEKARIIQQQEQFEKNFVLDAMKTEADVGLTKAQTITELMQPQLEVAKMKSAEKSKERPETKSE